MVDSPSVSVYIYNQLMRWMRETLTNHTCSCGDFREHGNQGYKLFGLTECRSSSSCSVHAGGSILITNIVFLHNVDM